MTRATPGRGPTTIQAWIHGARDLLRKAQVESPDLSAWLLLEEATGWSRSHLLARPEKEIPPEGLGRAGSLLERRLKHEPVAYLLERKSFRHLELRVTPSVLIPRPETEELVDWVLCRAPGSGIVVDAGTGSGCLALSLSQEGTFDRVLGSDRSPEALAVAKSNDPDGRVDWLLCDWLKPLAEGSVGCVVSNPPYLTTQEMRTLEPQVGSFEPKSALWGGIEGCDGYRELVPDAWRVLGGGGWVFLEGSPLVARPLLEILQAVGFGDIGCHKDLAGRDRFFFGRRPERP